jgi:hypothetical protein
MIKTFTLLGILIILGACSPGHIAANNGTDRWAHVGCHIVTNSPSKTGEYAIHPLGDLAIGDRLYFKQKNKDGTVGPVTTGVPCLD